MLFRLISGLFKKEAGILGETDEAMKKFMLVGLGNIGPEYAGTRHNVGFKILDALAAKMDFAFEPAKLADIGTFKVKGRQVLCIKPSTYMNRSGKAVKYWLDKEKIPLENVLIITDDINLPFGTLRLKSKGSDGGHNGLKDIQQVLQTTQYHRLRFGVGSDFSKGKQVDYVLGKWDVPEEEALPERMDRIMDLIPSFILAGPKITMNQFNNT
ncbi:aminoacyl-tRNA hydrolase [Lentiprolixibacter aurantiacus]|uniref:Peptidyl-tRNA hydrolase n=1 Tax=Lentiprolixibacter aurantiacus TaxID=2993939 RepID=A0AAE3MJI9_9FLAO|nr:aminoacyl-tRNA hydrolase [Lentiprolixibacter aurantiacus]MCX2718865.1 aminoacyl-tRNA hydrolase [Lentiprolixibacter aurantiacus]